MNDHGAPSLSKQTVFFFCTTELLVICNGFRFLQLEEYACVQKCTS
jgi:hypothetical protein